MKKFLILNYEFPPLGGGAGNATQYIARELVRMGHQVTVVTTWFSGLPEDTVIDGYRVIRVRARRERADRSTPLEMLSYVMHACRAVTRLVKHERPDVVISFFAIPTGLIAWYVWKRFHIPYIVSLRGGDVPGFLPHELNRFHMMAAPATALVWKRARHIVANSRGLQELAQKTAVRYGKEVSYIPNGIDTDEFSPAVTEPDGFRILFVGRLTEQKGVIHILHALHTIAQRDPEAFSHMTCTIVGDGPLRVSLEAEARDLGVNTMVTFRGWASRAELPEYFRSHTIFVSPSSEEGMPNTVLEAMASGTPVVATNIPGINELVEHERTGLLIQHPLDTADAILQMYHHPTKRRHYAQQARESAYAHSWRSVADAYTALYI